MFSPRALHNLHAWQPSKKHACYGESDSHRVPVWLYSSRTHGVVLSLNWGRSFSHQHSSHGINASCVHVHAGRQSIWVRQQLDDTVLDCSYSPWRHIWHTNTTVALSRVQGVGLYIKSTYCKTTDFKQHHFNLFITFCILMSVYRPEIREEQLPFTTGPRTLCWPHCMKSSFYFFVYIFIKVNTNKTQFTGVRAKQTNKDKKKNSIFFPIIFFSLTFLVFFLCM